MLKTRFFVDFRRVVIDDFRRFSQIFTNFDDFAHGSDCYQEANCYQMRSFSWIFDGFEQFSNQNSSNFGDWGKVLPERDQKRCGRENHMILQSVTWTCSKHDFSLIFVGYSSRIFDEFRRFARISTFLRMVLMATRKRIAIECVHFRGF